MELIHTAVKSVIENGRVGSPVFLRCVLNISSDDKDVLSSISELVSLSNGLIPSKPQKVYAQGETDGIQVTVMVQYVSGQMAVLSSNRVETETAIDLMLVGNKGVIYHETPLGRHYLNATPPQLGNTEELKDCIAESLATGEPVEVEE